MKDAVRATHGPQVLGGVGGFAGLYDASALLTYRKPLLATSTDGVGTKVAIAQALDIHDTIGFDLVGMVVDDIVVVGAKPLFMTDYIACGRVVPERIAGIVRGIAAACSVAGTALVGGETAEHPGPAGSRRVRRGRCRDGRRRGRPAAGPGAGARRRRAARAGLERSALQRVLAGPQGRVGGRLVAGPPRRRARPHARRGAPGAHPRLRLRLPRPGGARRRRRPARVQPRHRWGARVERRARAAAGPGRGHRPRRLDAAADLLAGAAARAGAVDRPRGHAQPGRRHGGDRRGRRRGRGPRARRRARPAGLGAGHRPARRPERPTSSAPRASWPGPRACTGEPSSSPVPTGRARTGRRRDAAACRSREPDAARPPPQPESHARASEPHRSRTTAARSPRQAQRATCETSDSWLPPSRSAIPRRARDE